MFGTEYEKLSELEKEIFYRVFEYIDGIGDEEMEEIAKELKITKEKVEEILIKLEKDGYLESQED
ncbi:MAG: hypothetical protein EAX96_19530 [Candidatus Lokiarchaeota archaeon]|nr:hypothetical protein [Candidatus Lokiarchaeota archaeon]